jgi:hypothetical protein
MSNSQKTIMYISIKYVNIISHTLQMEILNYFERHLQSVQHNVHSKPTVNCSLFNTTCTANHLSTAVCSTQCAQQTTCQLQSVQHNVHSKPTVNCSLFNTTCTANHLSNTVCSTQRAQQTTCQLQSHCCLLLPLYCEAELNPMCNCNCNCNLFSFI